MMKAQSRSLTIATVIGWIRGRSSPRTVASSTLASSADSMSRLPALAISGAASANSDQVTMRVPPIWYQNAALVSERGGARDQRGEIDQRDDDACLLSSPT